MTSDPWTSFENLAARARSESAPQTDVSGRVLRTLRTPDLVPPGVDREYRLAGLGSLLAACAALVLIGFGGVDDAFFLLAQPFYGVLP